MKLPVNMKEIAENAGIPDGRYRARISSQEVYPKPPAEIGEQGEVVGKQNGKGEQAYGWLRVGFKFAEHPANYVPNSKGEIKNLAGETHFENFSFHPRAVQYGLNPLFNSVGVPLDGDPTELVAKELDIKIKNKPRQDNPEIKEPNVVGTMVATG